MGAAASAADLAICCRRPRTSLSPPGAARPRHRRRSHHRSPRTGICEKGNCDPGVLCYLLSLLKRLGKLVVQVDELLHGYDLPAPAQEQEGWTTAVFTAVSIF